MRACEASTSLREVLPRTDCQQSHCHHHTLHTRCREPEVCSWRTACLHSSTIPSSSAFENSTIATTPPWSWNKMRVLITIDRGGAAASSAGPSCAQQASPCNHGEHGRCRWTRYERTQRIQRVPSHYSSLQQFSCRDHADGGPQVACVQTISPAFAQPSARRAAVLSRNLRSIASREHNRHLTTFRLLLLLHEKIDVCSSD
jgi:hypothetical protein